MNTAAIIFAAFLYSLGIGRFLFRILAYIEGKPVLCPWQRWALSLPLGGGVSAFTLFFLRVVVGYQAHPLAEAICGFIFAALGASVFSAVLAIYRRGAVPARPSRRGSLPRNRFYKAAPAAFGTEQPAGQSLVS